MSVSYKIVQDKTVEMKATLLGLHPGLPCKAVDRVVNTITSVGLKSLQRNGVEIAKNCKGIVVNVKRTQIQTWSYKNATMLESLSKSLTHCNKAFTMEVKKQHGKLFIKIMKLLESSGWLRKAFGPDVNLLLLGQYAEKGDVAMRNDCLKI